MMNWFKKQMIGRYGYDQLSMALVILSLLLILTAKLSRFTPIMYLSYIPLGISIYRMLSKQIQKRRLENYKFMMFLSPVYSFFKKKSRYIKDAKNHKYFKCRNCKQKLRVPKGKGKIMITCPKCYTKFTKKT